jgi:hypothetical protein
MLESLSIRAYARYRGCSPAAVRKAIERGQIVKDDAGLIVVAAADAAWPIERGPGADGEGEPEPAGGGEPAGIEGEPAAITYTEAKRRREVAKAMREELALAVAQGSLISIDYLDQQLAGALQGVRQVLLNLPGKLAPQLVGVATVARAQMLLQQAIDEAMPTLQAIGSDPTLDADDPPDSAGELAA